MYIEAGSWYVIFNGFRQLILGCIYELFPGLSSFFFNIVLSCLQDSQYPKMQLFKSEVWVGNFRLVSIFSCIYLQVAL